MAGPFGQLGHGFVVGLDDFGGDAAACGDFVAVLGCPSSDRGEVVAVSGGCGRCRSVAAGRFGCAAGFACVPDPLGQVVAELGGVAVGEVDFVEGAIDAEGDCLASGGGAESPVACSPQVGRLPSMASATSTSPGWALCWRSGRLLEGVVT